MGRIAGLTKEVHFEPGDTIFEEGGPGDSLYVLLTGQAVYEKKGKVICQIKEKEAFGTLAALDFQPRKFTTRAIDHVHAIRLDAWDFHDLLSLDG